MSTQGFTKLQPRQRLYIEGVTKGLSKQEAKRVAGYAESTNSYQVETPSVKAAFSRLLRQYVPAHKIARTIADGLEAKETKFFQHEGRVTDSRDVINHSERRQYAKMAAEFGQYVEPDAGASVNVGMSFVLMNGITKPK